MDKTCSREIFCAVMMIKIESRFRALLFIISGLILCFEGRRVTYGMYILIEVLTELIQFWKFTPIV